MSPPSRSWQTISVGPLGISHKHSQLVTATGALGTPSTGVKARVSYAAMYYDKANRMTDSVNVGTNAGSAYSRPGTVPSRSDTVLVSSVGYNAAGWQETSTDPKGLISKTYYDLLGRTTKTIENYVDGTVSDTDDKTVEYIYGPSGMTKLQAKLTGGGQQETEWVYGITSPVASNDTLKEMRYPDASTGSSSSSEKDAYTYNQLGEVLTTTDRNGNVHTITRDVLGRVTSDAVTTLGSGVDGAVRRIETGYDSQGNAYLITSYNAASGGSIVNQIQREYNGLGQLITEYQATSGAVNTSTTPKVQYSYSFAPSGSTNHSRLATITYPNGRALTYNYSSGLNSDISRLSSITDGATTLESYDYLGLGTVVRRGHAEPGVDLTSIKLSGESDSADSGDKYTGLDRFGRIVDQRWTTSGASAKERTRYGYDRNSNRLWRENVLDTTRSELYSYDGLNQLTTFDRGTLNGTKTGLTGAASRTQAWNFDALGNFDSQTTDGTTQTRTANKQNEITSISGGLVSPNYDANGNTKRDESRDEFKYDAWNRMVESKENSGANVVTYSWDGTGRRVREVRGGNTTDLYYSSAWQVIEERVGGTARISYAWSPVYVDAMIARDRDIRENGQFEERLYALHDANFNIVGLLDINGDIVERFAYDPFGTFTVLDASWASIGKSEFEWIYLHQGGRWDADAGVYSFRHREYSPTLGRWMTNDPIGISIRDTNLYAAYLQNSINRTDPTGNTSFHTMQQKSTNPIDLLPPLPGNKKPGSPDGPPPIGATPKTEGPDSSLNAQLKFAIPLIITRIARFGVPNLLRPCSTIKISGTIKSVSFGETTSLIPWVPLPKNADELIQTEKKLISRLEGISDLLSATFEGTTPPCFRCVGKGNKKTYSLGVIDLTLPVPLPLGNPTMILPVKLTIELKAIITIQAIAPSLPIMPILPSLPILP
jgi:RHS repeat-associated protein